LLLIAWIVEQRWLEAAVEIALQIASIGGYGGGVAQGENEVEPSAVEVRWVAAPSLQQPNPIALIPVGAGHHQHGAAACGVGFAVAVGLDVLTQLTVLNIPVRCDRSRPSGIGSSPSGT
jgi:hypothetical protein